MHKQNLSKFETENHWPYVLVAPPKLAIELWLKNQVFTFSTSSLKQPADGASYYARRFPRPRPL